MPKLRISEEERVCNRFSDLIRGELKRQGRRHADLAEELNLPTVAVTNRLNGKTRWTLPEMVTAVIYLDTVFEIKRP